MKNRITKLSYLLISFLILSSLFVASIYCKAPIANGSSLYSGSLYHMDNVGVGLQSPDSDLHIFRSLANSSTDPFFKINYESSVSTPFSTFTINKTSILVDSDGNLGVGTNSPDTRLDVSGNMDIVGDISIKSCLMTDFFTGQCAIGSDVTNIKLHGNGLIRAREILVDLGTIPDYVFEDDYDLMPLDELKTFIDANGHLPNVISATEFQKEEGYALGMMNRKLLEKVEELTLYILDLQAQINDLKK